MRDVAPTRRGMLAGAAAAVATPAAAADAPKLILLGTGGGPGPKANRAATSQAIVWNGKTYIVDCGDGVARQMAAAGLAFSSLRALFITHHHSDHNADYGNLLWLAWASTLTSPVDTYGPPPLTAMTRQFLELNAFDIETRIADEGRPPLAPLIRPHEITRDGVVMRDGDLTVTAALVDHPPVLPAFAYRFDAPGRSIVISGDTAKSANLIRLARGADVLVHEVLYMPALDRLTAQFPNARTLREHLVASHTSCEDVGRLATEAGVKTLVLSHLVPGGPPIIPDDAWRDAVAPYFKGELIVGRDLMVI
jgi:ribonuclease BN (tRNA processing enzyme)